MKTQLKLIREAVLLGMILYFSPMGALGETGIPWPLAPEGGEADPRVRWGVLENGMHYALLPSDVYPGEISMRLMVDVGSSQEEDSELGHAHFVEHMAFNGTTHFSTESLREFFIGSGINFGSHAAAWTTAETTSYSIDLKESNKERLEQSFDFFQDVVMGLNFNEDKIERESTVILDEKRLREKDRSVEFSIATSAFALGGVDRRFVNAIGKADTIKSATRESLKAFWDKWYRPERVYIFIAGDFDENVTKKRIQETFAHFQARSDLPAGRNELELSVTTGDGAGFFSYPEDKVTVCQLLRLGKQNLFNAEEERRYHTLGIASNVARESKYQRFWIWRAHEHSFISMNFLAKNPSNWGTLVSQVQRDRKRLVRDGVDKRSWERVISLLTDDLISGNATLERETPFELADAFRSAFSDRRPFRSGRVEMHYQRELLDSLSRDSINALLREVFTPDAINYLICIEDGDERDVSEIVEYANLGQWIWSPLRRSHERNGATLKTDFGKAGEIRSRDTLKVDGREVVQLVFENNIRVNLAATKLEANTARFRIEFGSGVGAFDTVTAGLPQIGDGLVGELKLTKLEKKGIKALLREEGVRSIESGMKLDTGYAGAWLLGEKGVRSGFSYFSQWLEESEFNSHSFRWAKNRARFEFNHDNLQESLYADLYPYTIGRDWRLLEAGEWVFENFNQSELEAWVLNEARSGYCEISLVGDFDLEAAVATAAETFGTLKQRSDKPEQAAFAKPVVLKEGGNLVKKSYRLGNRIDTVSAYVPLSCDGSLYQESVAVMMGAMLQHELRLKIREEMGVSYSVAAGSFGDPGLAGSFGLWVQVTTSPENAVALARMIHFSVSEIISGVTASELINTARPYREELSRRWQNNESIAVMIRDAQRYPRRFEEHKGLEAYLTSETFEKDLEQLKRDVIPEKITSLAVYQRILDDESINESP